MRHRGTDSVIQSFPQSELLQFHPPVVVEAAEAGAGCCAVLPRRLPQQHNVQAHITSLPLLLLLLLLLSPLLLWMLLRWGLLWR